MIAWAIHIDEPIPYAKALRLQEALLAARIAERIPDTIIYLQHTPVVTLGRRRRDEHLLLTPDQLAQRGVDYAEASRGGDVTYHAPGQLVMYPIIKLGTHDMDSHGHLWNLEQTAIDTAAGFGVPAYRREGMNGAWTDAGKISAIGFRLKRWVTYHGMSFNVDVDLSGFNVIVPCGLIGEPISSLSTILKERCPSVAEVRSSMALHFESIAGRTQQLVAIADLPDDVAEMCE